jgi:hypothetical protein
MREIMRVILQLLFVYDIGRIPQGNQIEKIDLWFNVDPVLANGRLLSASQRIKREKKELRAVPRCRTCAHIYFRLSCVAGGMISAVIMLSEIAGSLTARTSCGARRTPGEVSAPTRGAAPCAMSLWTRRTRNPHAMSHKAAARQQLGVRFAMSFRPMSCLTATVSSCPRQ